MCLWHDGGDVLVERVRRLTDPPSRGGLGIPNVRVIWHHADDENGMWFEAGVRSLDNPPARVGPAWYLEPVEL